MRTIALTVLALAAFAANSVLCRLALGDGAIDPASFSGIRLVSGAATLLMLTAAGTRRSAAGAGSWTSAAALFVYAVPFSFAYLNLTAGTGALILFGCVQITMMGAALRAGERPGLRQWIGLVLAFSGLAYLVRPGLASPSPAAASLMALAGVSWAIYTLRGRQAGSPLADTTGNFVRTLPLVLLLGAVSFPTWHLELRGVLLAVASGALASGLGYAVWYLALVRLTRTRAAVVQIAVPVLTALAGSMFLAEPIPERLVAAGTMVLGGIALAVVSTPRTS
jgi:drug/metabolite transporter (DMT)-like permease